jgi:HNH endonuclease
VKESQTPSLKSRRASQARRDLVLDLGGKCSACGKPEPLEFHFTGLDPANHHYMPWPQRIRWYWGEHLKGNITLLCRNCHRLVTHKESFQKRHPKQIAQKNAALSLTLLFVCQIFFLQTKAAPGARHAEALFSSGDGI